MTPRPLGIAGLEGVEPVGAVLTIGTKGPRGNPVERDRFWIKAVDAGEDDSRPPHPRFTTFNEADAEKRKVMSGVLVHADRASCFEFGLTAHILPGMKAHPKRMPHCAGDGKRALRWDPTKGELKSIVCPHDACEFRQGDNKPCKPWMRFLFRPVWGQNSKLSTPLMKYTSHSWNTVRAFVGFFGYVSDQAKALGVSDPSYFGISFDMTLGEKTNRERKTRFPVVSIAPTLDIQGFLLAQHRLVAELASPHPVAALTDSSQQDPAVVHLDSADITPQRSLFGA